MYTAISKDLNKSDSFSSVSDLYGGLSKGSPNGKIKIRGGWGHHTSYWGRFPDMRDIESEAFAHFFEAQFDTARAAHLDEYFPKSHVRFKKILEGI